MEECLMVSAHILYTTNTSSEHIYIKSSVDKFILVTPGNEKILKVLPDLSGQMIHFRKRTISNSQSFCRVCDLLPNDMYSRFILRPVIIMNELFCQELFRATQQM